MFVINVVIGRFSGEDLKRLAHVTVRFQPNVRLQLCRLIGAKHSSLCTNHIWENLLSLLCYWFQYPVTSRCGALPAIISFFLRLNHIFSFRNTAFQSLPPNRAELVQITDFRWPSTGTPLNKQSMFYELNEPMMVQRTTKLVRQSIYIMFAVYCF